MTKFDENEIYHEMYLHLLWSTKNQQSLIQASVAQALYGYLCDLALSYESHVIAGIILKDHIQLVLKFSPNTTLHDITTNFKVASVLWLRSNFPEMKNIEWQKSDFSFSVGFEEVGFLMERMKNAKSFSDEINFLLIQKEMKYDPPEILE